MSRIAIIAALPREISQVTLGWSRQPVVIGTRKLSLAWSDEAIAVAGGMGGANAVRALDLLQNFDAARSLGPIHAVLSVGFAGALTAQSHPGRVFRPSTVLDVQTGERIAAADGDGSLCITAPAIADAEERARLAATYGAQLVDMEAAPLARICAAQGLPFYAFKSISDAYDFSLPALGQFATPQGDFRIAAFALHIALRPKLWRSAIELGRGAGPAQVTLAAALRSWLASRHR
jgi:adenosylhomocysteine nucleosidase